MQVANESIHILSHREIDAGAHKKESNAWFKNQASAPQMAVWVSSIPAVTLFLFRQQQDTAEFAKAKEVDSSSPVDFFIRVNPARHTTTKVLDRRIDRVIPLIKLNDQQAWLKSLFERAGMDIIQSERISHDATPCSIGATTINDCWFKGQFNVIDEGLYLSALRDGIGKRKRFGFGMLITRPSKHYDFLDHALTIQQQKG